MSEPKRACLITVGAPKNAKNKVTKTVRLSINLCESNENKYPELNYKELVEAEEKRKLSVNGAQCGHDSSEEELERVAKKFEQQYGGNSTYGRKNRTMQDIGAGYDENDSFIDNTHGYDEIVPPECDTYHGGFYINCGSLEFKNVSSRDLPQSDNENVGGHRSNKRRISSSSSEDESSDSSSDSESQDREEKTSGEKPVLNGNSHSHKTDKHRKKKNKKEDKKKAKRIRREGISAPTSGKHTSDDNAPVDAESVDSRTSQSDSLTSKPAPSSENAVTSDSSRDGSDAKAEVKFPTSVSLALNELSAMAARFKHSGSDAATKELDTHFDPLILRLEVALSSCGGEVCFRRSAWARAARTLGAPRTRLLQRARVLVATQPAEQPPPVISLPIAVAPAPEKSKPKPRVDSIDLEAIDITRMDPVEREKQICSALDRLKSIIEDRKPSMIENYKLECEKVQEENKKMKLASGGAEGARLAERRLPKRRFPWCARTRALLAGLARLAGAPPDAAVLLARRALPLFPSGFVRIPTLLRQANLNKELANMKMGDIKKQKYPLPMPQIPTSENIQLPSSITVTTTKVLPEKSHSEVACGTRDDKENGKSKSVSNTEYPSTSKPKSQFSNIFNNCNLAPNTEVFLEKQSDKDSYRSSKDVVTVEKTTVAKTSPDNASRQSESEKYVPPNNIGSITITPVTNTQKFDPRHQASKLANNVVSISSKALSEPLIRVKSPAALIKAADEIAYKEKHKNRHSELKTHSSHSKNNDKRSNSPLKIDTSFQPKEQKKIDILAKSPNRLSPNISKDRTDDVKKMEGLKMSESNIPRPGLIPVHHSPTFAKPADKRPSEKKNKSRDNQVLIISDVDPLGDVQGMDAVAVDDSSSDVELIEDPTSKVNDVAPIDGHKKDDKPKTDLPNNHKVSDGHTSHNSHSSKHSKRDKSKSHKSDKPSSKSEKAVDEKESRVRPELNFQEKIKRMDVVGEDGQFDFDKVMQGLREMQDSQEQPFSSSPFAGIIPNEKKEECELDDGIKEELDIGPVVLQGSDVQMALSTALQQPEALEADSQSQDL